MAKPPQTNNQPKAVIASQQWTGPLPPPDALQRFDEIIEGGAERILRMAEQEQAHRISAEKATNEANIGDTKRGQYLGTLIMLAAIGGAVTNIVLNGHPAATVAMVGVPILGVIDAIIRGHRRKG